MLPEFIILAIGVADDLSRAALKDAVAKTKSVNDRLPRSTALMLTLDGFDDDPRELWEIAEARDFLLAFAAGIIQAGIPLERFLPESVRLITACLATRRGKTVIVNDDDKLAQELLEYQQRVRRSTN